MPRRRIINQEAKVTQILMDNHPLMLHNLSTHQLRFSNPLQILSLNPKLETPTLGAMLMLTHTTKQAATNTYPFNLAPPRRIILKATHNLRPHTHPRRCRIHVLLNLMAHKEVIPHNHPTIRVHTILVMVLRVIQVGLPVAVKFTHHHPLLRGIILLMATSTVRRHHTCSGRMARVAHL